MSLISKKTLLSVLLVVSGFNVGSVLAQTSLPVVPKPYSVVQSENGKFEFSETTDVFVDNEFKSEDVHCILSIYKRLNSLFFNELNFNVRNLEAFSQDGSNSDVKWITVRKNDELDVEEYKLIVSENGIKIEAATEAGLFYAFQTLMLASEPDNRNSVPLMEVADKPRFEYRGLMLDVSRFFIPKEDVLRIIDCMSMLKLNKLHLHLTDDNGWRLEIKKYPKLTEVGAWRVNRNNLDFPDRRNSEVGEPVPVGGFYTQKDIKDIVEYAQQRYVEIIPEIDMPGHSNAALAAYPELACPSVDKPIGVVPGMGQGSGSIILCAGNDNVFSFIEDVIDEVAELFPSKYIHIGGDEAWKEYWNKCPRCAERMKAENISHIEELQSYFMRRVSDYVKSKGKHVMGWDELTNGTLPHDVVIFGWQGMGNAALKAAAQGHKFVMTPARLLYLIRYQGPQWFEPLTYFGNNTIKDVYMYEPVQPGWDKNYENLLMGVQASMWTEFCKTPRDVYYQIFPRLVALSEVAWSQKGTKDWNGFADGLDNVLVHLSAKGINYSEAMFNIQHKAVSENGKVKVDLSCDRPDVEIRYTTDGMEPDASSSLYAGPLYIDSDTEIRCATYKNGVKKGETLNLDIDWNLATGKEIISSSPADKVLTNGIRGSKKQSDFEWTEWYTKDDVSFILDLGSKTDISKVTLGCLSYYAMGVNKPKSIIVKLSSDGKEYRESAVRNFSDSEIFKVGNFIEDISFDIADGKRVRYVQVVYKYPGDCPANHLKPDQQSRCRFDEIIVE